MARRRSPARGPVAIALVGLLLYLGGAAPAAGQDADADPASTFVWDDPRLREAFQACMEIVDGVAHGRSPDAAAYPWEDTPGDIDRELWNGAVNAVFFRGLHVNEESDDFAYRPRCDALLPDDYETRIPARYHSEVFTRCLASVGGDRLERPNVVPAWYWEASWEAGDCYLLLPLGAFGLGPDDNAWSQWTEQDEAETPRPDTVPDALSEEYHHCRDYIGWRMDGGATFAGLGSLYDDPPNGASPPRVWHEALHHYVDPTRTNQGDATTVPANWSPDCELLLITEDCDPSGPSNPSLLPEACVGPHATSSYDIGYSQYDDPDEEGLPSISRNLWGASTQYAYMLAKGGVAVAVWAVDWAYNFDVSRYNPLAIAVGDNYEDLLDAPGLRLRELFWLLLVGWAGYTALRGRMAVAGSEVMITVVLLLVTGFLLVNREMYMAATWRLMNEGETTLLVAGMGDDPADASAAQRARIIEDLQQHIHRAFVEEPYDHLNWGRALGSADDSDNPLRACAAARDYILARGPHGADKWPRQQMTEAGPECEPLVRFNRDPDGTRLLGAILLLLSALAIAVMLIVVGLTVVVCKVVAILLFAVVPFATLMATLPAHGRRLTWSWAATLMQMVIAVIGMSFLLSLLLLTLRQLIDLTDQVDLIERFAVMDLVVAIVFAARRSMLRSGQRFAARLTEFLSATRGSGTTWASAAASAGPGLDLLNVDRTAFLGGVYGGGAPAVVAGAMIKTRYQERRVARRSYRNLENVSRWKRAQNDSNRRWAVRHAGRRRGVLYGPRINPAEPRTWPRQRQPLG